MWGEVFKWISVHYPLLLALLAVIVLTWTIAKQYYHWKKRIEKNEDECKKIDGQIIPQLTTISTSVTSLNGSFNSLVLHLQAKDGTLPAALFISKSPIRLTDLGIKILNDIGGKSFVDTHLGELIYRMNLREIKTALDSQTIAPFVITEMSNDASFKNIKDYIFRSPIFNAEIEGKKISVQLDLTTVANIMGIYLRDEYLKLNPHLNPEDIPSEDPPNHS